MGRQFSIAEARNQFARLVHVAEQGMPVRITRRGKAIAVLVSEKTYGRAQRRARRGIGDAILQWREKHGSVQLSRAEIDSWRDRKPARIPDFSDL